MKIKGPLETHLLPWLVIEDASLSPTQAQKEASLTFSPAPRPGLLPAQRTLGSSASGFGLIKASPRNRGAEVSLRSVLSGLCRGH